MVFNEEWQFPATTTVDTWVYSLKVHDDNLIDRLIASGRFGVVG